MKVRSYEMDESESESETWFKFDKFCYEGSSFLDFRTSLMMRVYTDDKITKSYEELGNRTQGLEEAKRKILSYTPGSWIEKVDSMKLSNYDVPETTSLMLVGPKGSGKTSLINRISKVFEDDKFAPERAQVSYKDTVGEPNHSYVGEGTLFLHKYMIPRESSAFCLYDTRSLSDYSHENIITLERWMTKGVRHGELVIRESDNKSLMTRLKIKAFKKSCMYSSKRDKVNFVIFVVNGHSVLRSMRSEGEDTHYVKLIASAFNSPFVSFRDDRPLVVVTHGDLLELFERVYVRLYLGKILGISPTKQIFDIPADSSDPETDVVIVDMLRSALEHADKNLPPKTIMNKVLSPFQSSAMRLLMVVVVLVIAILLAMVFRGHIDQVFGLRPNFLQVSPKQDIQWHKIRHLWLDGVD